MGIFDFWKKEDKLGKDDKKIFSVLVDELSGRQLTDQAISFRNLKQYDNAINLLKKAIYEYNYLSANSVLGNTLAMKGDIDAAEAHFKKMLSDCIKEDNYFLIEIYANLGSLYHKYRKDVKTALRYYDLALNAPKSDSLSEKAYEVMVAGVYHDLCVIYYNLEEFPLAKQYAFKRLQIVKDCPFAARIYGWCLFSEMINEEFIDMNGQNTDLETVVEYLQIALRQSPDDYAIVAGIATTLFYMSRIKFYQNNPTLINSIKQSEKEYIQRLEKCSKQSEDAKIALKFYQDNVNSFLTGRSEDAATWFSKGKTLVSLGKYQEAIDCFDRAIEINPRYAEVWCVRGTLFAMHGQGKEAIVCCDKALEINPRYADAWSLKALTEDELGLRQAATLSYKKFIELNPPESADEVEEARQRLMELGDHL